MTPECKLCLGPHDEAIHGATERVHGWLRRRLLLKLGPPPVIEPKANPYLPNLSAIRELRSPAARAKEKGVRNKSRQR